jgi:TonB family protein
MELRQNILCSLVLHTMIILSSFAVSVSVGDVTERFRNDYLTVSLFKEMTGTQSITHQSTKKDENEISSVIVKRERVYKKEIAWPELALSNKTRFFANSQNDKSGETASKNSLDKVDITISTNHNAGISEETKISNSSLKENESNPPESPHTPLWKRDNPPKSPFIKGGLEGDFKMGMGGLPEQNSAFQNTGKSQSGNEILESIKRRAGKGNTSNPYALIRAAIEKARTYPFLARKKRIEGTVVIDFTINSKGYPQDIKIGKSSGSEILNSAAIKIVMKAAPFPAVDGKIAVPISFKLTGYPPSYISSR